MAANRRAAWAASVGVALAVGCTSTPVTRLVDPLGVFFSQEEPVRIGINRVHLPLSPLAWHPPWWPLQEALTREVGRPVQFESLQPFQIKAHLRDGRLSFALVTATDYAEIAEGGIPKLLCVAVHSAGRSERVGLIVVAANSDVKSVADLKGKRFAFGPRRHPVLHVAAVDALAQGGVSVADLRKELLPLPGSLQFHLNGPEAAKAIVYEFGIEAGVIDELAYEQWPATGGTLLPLSFSRDQVRVLARTAAVPEDAVLVAPDCDPDLAAKVKRFLEAGANDVPAVLEPLGIAKFVPGQAAAHQAFAAKAKAVLGKQ